MPNKLKDFCTTTPFLSNLGTAFSFPCDHEMGNGRFLTWFYWQSEWQSELMFFFLINFQGNWHKLTCICSNSVSLTVVCTHEMPTTVHVRSVLWEPAPKTPVAPSPMPLVPGKQSPVVTINSFAFFTLIDSMQYVCFYLLSLSILIFRWVHVVYVLFIAE